MFDWLKKIVTRSKTGISQDPWFLRSLISNSGVNVTENTCYSLPALYRGLTLISGTLARLPIQVIQHGADGSRQIDAQHFANSVLNRFSEAESTFNSVQNAVNDFILFGNSYFYIQRNGVIPSQLIRLNPTLTYPYSVDGEVWYATSAADGSQIDLDPGSVLHFKNLTLSTSSLYGRGLLDLLKQSIGLHAGVQEYSTSFYANSSQPSVILSVPGFIDDSDKKRELIERWERRHKGSDKAFKVALLEGGATASPFKLISPQETQSIQMAQQQIADCANMLGLPSAVLQGQQNTSYASLEVQNQQILTYCLLNIIEPFEQELSFKLLSEVQKQSRSHSCEFDTTELEKADRQKEHDILVSCLNNGLLSQNECRAKLNLSRIETEEADKFRMPANTIYTDTPADRTTAQTQEIVDKVMSRGIDRIKKATLAKANDANFSSWLQSGYNGHWQILQDNLGSEYRDRVIQARDRFREELSAVTRDQIPAVLERISL